MKHLAIIPDGNRRWARDRGLPTLEGHRRGYDAFKEVALACLDRGIEHISIWGFSTENWRRSEEEVAYLMDLFMTIMTHEVKFFLKHDIRLKVIGSREELSSDLVGAIERAEDQTRKGSRGQLNICINYGGQAELLSAMQSLLNDGITAEELSSDTLTSKLWTKDIPPPDLIIRTSGEQRTSGFMLWNAAYSEWLFLEKYWPDFTEDDLDRALKEFERRERRFGK